MSDFTILMESLAQKAGFYISYSIQAGPDKTRLRCVMHFVAPVRSYECAVERAEKIDDRGRFIEEVLRDSILTMAKGLESEAAKMRAYLQGGSSAARTAGSKPADPGPSPGLPASGHPAPECEEQRT